MADYYVDHGAYASNLGAAPTWGVPQDGDGSATTAATAASIGSIKFTTVPTTGTISVCGASVATTSVIGAASADAAANQLATNINATTATASASAAYGTPQLRNLVYARGPAGGAAAGTCEIMARIGSASLNTATNSSAAITSTFDGTPTVTQFAGGSGGCWGWIYNDAVLGNGSTITIGTYGIGIAKPYVLPAGVSALTVSDYVYARSGTGKTIDTAGNSWIRSAVGHPVNLIVDTNTRWTGDSGTGIVKVILKANAASTIQLNPDNSNGSTNQVMLAAIMKGGLKFEFEVSNASASFELRDHGMVKLYHVEISEKSGAAVGTSSYFMINMNGSGTGTLHMVSCMFSAMSSRASLPQTLTQYGGQQGYWNFEDCDFNFNLSGTQNVIDGVGLISVTSANATIRFDNCRFSTNSSNKLRWFGGAQSSTTANLQVILDRNTGVRINSSGMGLQAAQNFQKGGMALPSLSLSSADAGFSFRHERNTGVVDWDYEQGTYPYLSATQPDGTPYSVHLQWFGNSYPGQASPMYTPKNTQLNRLANGVRTIGIEMLVEPGRSIDATMLAVQVSYVDTSGLPRRENTFLTTNISTSTASWTFRGGNFSTYLPKKYTVVTSQSVATNTEISVELMVFASPPGTGNSDIFIDPLFTIS